MNSIDILKSHVKSLSKSTKNNLHLDLIAFLDRNKGLNEDDLINKFNEKYGERLRPIESIVNNKNMQSIKQWMDIFGFCFIALLLIYIITLII